MRVKSLLLVSMVSAVLAGCDSGGIDLNVATTDNSVTNGGGGSVGGINPCASYTTSANVLRQGVYDGSNCTYGSSFVGTANPLAQSVTLPAITGDHIFEDSLFVGQNVTSGAAPASGTGPTLTIAAGSTLAFKDPGDYVLINRGSRIIAQGTAARPITFTGFTDAVSGTAGPEDVQLWGGVVLNGNGITNNCTDAQRTANQCHIVSEGAASNYGGANNADNSGILRYVVIKHAGFEVAPDDELNGLTLNAVGSGTTIDNIQIYSAYDDGIEFFGGAVNVRNYVALYVRDDSIDFSDGWSGSVENALVIHSRGNGNWCVEGDNIGSARSDQGQPFETTPISNPLIRNMTCITSQSRQGPTNGTGTHGDSRGILIRQGARARIEDSIVFGGYGQIANPATPAGNTQCFQLTSAPTLAAAAAGTSQLDGSIIACQTPALAANVFANTDRVDSWLTGVSAPTGTANYSFNVGNVIINAPTNANVRVLEPNSFYTATALTDAANAVIPALAAPRRYGAVSRASDWTANWTYGLTSPNRGQPLWFE